MAMKVGKSGDDGAVMIDINTTPLIDVMLVLLIMLIITIPVRTHEIDLDISQGNPPIQIVPPEVVTLEVDFDGTILWNGTVVPDRAALQERFRAEAKKRPQAEVHLVPNKLAKYSSVAMVLAEAQRLGVMKIGLVGNDKLLD